MRRLNFVSFTIFRIHNECLLKMFSFNILYSRITTSIFLTAKQRTRLVTYLQLFILYTWKNWVEYTCCLLYWFHVGTVIQLDPASWSLINVMQIYSPSKDNEFKNDVMSNGNNKVVYYIDITDFVLILLAMLI